MDPLLIVLSLDTQCDEYERETGGRVRNNICQTRRVGKTATYREPQQKRSK
jgi:hypothetical protein